MNLPPITTPLLAGFACLILNSCAAVISKAPVGAAPAALEEDDWAGTWATEDLAISVEALELDDGVLRISYIEKENDEIKLKVMPVYIREGTEWTYLNIRYTDAEEDEEDMRPDADSLFFWARIKNEDGVILVWLPDAGKISQLVVDGKLPGTAKPKNSDVYLDKFKPEHLELIESEDEGILFDWDDPIVLRRVTYD